MDNTQEIESPEVFNKELLEAIAGAEDGHLKKASAAASKMVRRRIRENGFSRLAIRALGCRWGSFQKRIRSLMQWMPYFVPPVSLFLSIGGCDAASQTLGGFAR